MLSGCQAPGLNVTGLTQRSSAHEWFNTAIAAVALLVSGTSAYFAWQSNQAKEESLAMVVRPLGDCRTEYHGGPEAGQIGLCWAVTLANQSENRLSIVDQRVFDIQDGKTAWIGGFQNLEAANGTPLALPMTLDGGEAREIFVRGAVMVPPAVAHAIAQMPEFQNHTLGSLPLASVQRALAMANLDFIGNKVDPTIIDGKYLGFSMSPPVKGVVNVLTVTTGRGATFSARMTYPPDFDRHQAAP
jgi:hypothetical protein